MSVCSRKKSNFFGLLVIQFVWCTLKGPKTVETVSLLSVSESARYYTVDLATSSKYILFYVVGKKTVENVLFNGTVVLHLGQLVKNVMSASEPEKKISLDLMSCAVA